MYPSGIAQNSLLFPSGAVSAKERYGMVLWLEQALECLSSNPGCEPNPYYAQMLSRIRSYDRIKRDRGMARWEMARVILISGSGKQPQRDRFKLVWR